MEQSSVFEFHKFFIKQISFLNQNILGDIFNFPPTSFLNLVQIEETFKKYQAGDTTLFFGIAITNPNHVKLFFLEKINIWMQKIKKLYFEHNTIVLIISNQINKNIKYIYKINVDNYIKNIINIKENIEKYSENTFTKIEIEINLKDMLQSIQNRNKFFEKYKSIAITELDEVDYKYKIKIIGYVLRKVSLSKPYIVNCINMQGINYLLLKFANKEDFLLAENILKEYQVKIGSGREFLSPVKKFKHEVNKSACNEVDSLKYLIRLNLNGFLRNPVDLIQEPKRYTCSFFNNRYALVHKFATNTSSSTDESTSTVTSLISSAVRLSSLSQ